jgi:dethiobiotin synthetase
LNHALLTAQAIEHSGLKLAGWVANNIEPRFERASDNIRALQERLKAPLLGIVPHRPGLTPTEAAEHLRLDNSS